MKIEEMNKDVRNYKDKFLGPFSGREVLCLIFGVGLSYLVKTFFFPDMSPLSEEMSYIVIACMIPFVIIGWTKPYGMYIEKYLKSTFISTISPRVRTYANGNRIPRKKIKTKKSKNNELRRFH